MIKIFNYLLISVFFLFSSEVMPLSSSSYLVANTAISLFDFEKADTQYNLSDQYFNESDLHNKMLTSINLGKLNDAKIIAEKIININQFNQEAWVINLAYAKITNELNIFSQYKKIQNNNMELLDFIFFSTDKEIKKNKIISKSILEIVKASISENIDEMNYKFLFFYLSVAILIDEELYELYFYKAQMFQILKNFEKAEYFYNKIPETNQLFLESQKNIAINKNENGFFLQAEKKLKELIILYEDDINLKITLANLYRVEKDYKNAIKNYSDIVNLKKTSLNDYWQIYYFRGICYERLSEWNLAEKDFLYSLEINSDSPQVLNYLAYGWIERNENIDLAIEMLTKAYKVNPNSYHILDSLAWGYFKNNQIKKAAKLMERVVEMAPGEAISLYHMGDIYFAMNRKREASYFWKQALDLTVPEDMILESIKSKLDMFYAG